MKSEPKFTPGKWAKKAIIFSKNEWGSLCDKEDTKFTCVTDISPEKCDEEIIAAIWGNDEQEEEFYASLISKAPEMYELVRNLAIFPSKYSLAHIINMAQKLLQQIDGTEGE